MRVAVASDHAGFALKQYVAATLRARGHEVLDVGADSDEPVDYPNFAAAAARLVSDGAAERGVLVCGSGVGVAIVANRIARVRAVNAHDADEVALARRHNDVNVVALAGRRLGPELADEIVATFLQADFEGGRHARRVAAIEQI
jgi:ribose 5-phosphate isomerase B